MTTSEFDSMAGKYAGKPLKRSLITRLKAGDEAAFHEVWRRYGAALAGVARRWLSGAGLRDVDEEDVAQSAYKSFWRGVLEGRFLQLETSKDIWQLLLVIAQRKAYGQIRRGKRLKRGGGRIRGDSVFSADLGAAGANAIVGNDPDPAILAASREACARLLDALSCADLRKIARLKLEGCTDNEIAQRLSCSRSTIARKLRLIRDIWRRQAENV